MFEEQTKENKRKGGSGRKMFLTQPKLKSGSLGPVSLGSISLGIGPGDFGAGPRNPGTGPGISGTGPEPPKIGPGSLQEMVTGFPGSNPETYGSKAYV